MTVTHTQRWHSMTGTWTWSTTSQCEFARSQWPCLNLKIANDSGPGIVFAEWPVIGCRLLLGAARGLDMVGHTNCGTCIMSQYVLICLNCTSIMTCQNTESYLSILSFQVFVDWWFPPCKGLPSRNNSQHHSCWSMIHPIRAWRLLLGHPKSKSFQVSKF